MKFEDIQGIINSWQGKRVAVIGDLMLDRYVWGSASRISPEAPVPVVKVDKTTSSPGGSANVLRNLASLGGTPVAFGLIGDDSTGDELRGLLDDLNVKLDGIVVDDTRRTIEKTRILAGNQQVVRVDTEDVEEITQDKVGELLKRLEEQADCLDAIIVEDYAKGTLTQALLSRVVEIAKKHDIPVALDPHPANAFNVKGMSLITPNRREAFAMAGMYFVSGVLPIEEDISLHNTVLRMQELWEPDHLLITLGSGGMALFDKGRPDLHIPTRAKEVFDVSGAGDTVIASFVLSLLSGATPREAAVVSNHAAGIVVGKVGTAPVSAAELQDSFKMETE